jgi:hypothetical protein
MLFQAAIARLTMLSVSVFVAHAIDAFRTYSPQRHVNSFTATRGHPMHTVAESTRYDHNLRNAYPHG